MKSPIYVAVLLAALSSLPALAEDLVIEGVGLSRDFECAGQDVLIAGAKNEITLTGKCGAIEVIGSDHTIMFETARSLVISGAQIAATGRTLEALLVDVADNTVRATISAAKGPAEVNIAGAGQKVDLMFASEAKVTVNGSENEILWSTEGSAKAPAISAAGLQHRIKRK